VAYEIPDEMMQTRIELSKRYLHGKGIEIGALHLPLPVEENTIVRYVDRYEKDGLLKHYPELKGYPLVDIDVCDNGEQLKKIKNNKLDFIIASHFLEHCSDFIGTITNHLKKLKNGGILFYIIPNMRNCFDRDRSPTSFEHFLEDSKDGGRGSRMAHYLEWSLRVDKVPQEEAMGYAERLEKRDYSIHFHVWNEETMKDHLVQIGSVVRNYKTKEYILNGAEIIFILEKIKKERSAWFQRVISLFHKP